MAKKEQKQLILWAVVALVLGVLIGVLLTSAVTTGSAISVTSKNSKLQEEIIEERIDLRLNNLFVNSISNNSTSPNASIALNSHIKSYKGLVWGNYEGQTALLITENTNTANNGNSEIIIKAPITIYQPLKIKEINGIIGEDITIDSRDGDLTNSRGGLHLVGDWVEIYGLRDVQIKSPFISMGNQVNSITIDGNITRFWGGPITVESLAAGADTNYTGNAYACLTSSGTLFRSQVPCN